MFHGLDKHMKKNTHPKYYDSKVTCACGNSFAVGATKEKIDVEICSNCHPFYTGKNKLIDATGRVDKFKKRAEKKKATKKKTGIKKQENKT